MVRGRARFGGRGWAGGCGLPELDLEGEERVEEVGADEAGDEKAAGAVGGDFFAPEGGVGLGPDGVERAAVPKAAVEAEVAVACFPSMVFAERFSWLTLTAELLSREPGMVRLLRSSGPLLP